VNGSLAVGITEGAGRGQLPASWPRRARESG